MINVSDAICCQQKKRKRKRVVSWRESQSRSSAEQDDDDYLLSLVQRSIEEIQARDHEESTEQESTADKRLRKVRMSKS